MAPMMDVSSALTNRYTSDTFTVLRRQQTVDDYGETKMVVTTIPKVRGVVAPTSPSELSRRAEAQTNAKTIEIFTRFALRGESNAAEDGNTYQPDYVYWNANSFLVKSVEDWSKFARGFVKATCESVDMVDQAPRPTANAGTGPSENEQ